MQRKRGKSGKSGKWLADVAYTLPEPEPTTAQGVMGIDLGVKVPAVVHVINTGTRCFGNGRQQRAKRRQFYARRKELQAARTVRAVRTSQGTAARWMRDTNHKLSHASISHAQAVGIIRLEQLAGVRQRITRRTARTSRGATGRTAANARHNNRMIATWTFHQLAMFIADKAERAGIAVEWVDPVIPARPVRRASTATRQMTAAMSVRSVAGRDIEMSWARSTPVAGLAGVVTAPVPP
jgi:putative transposase